MQLAAGTRLGPYELEALVGSGGMGEVYRARDTRLGHTVAIKVVRADLGRDPEIRRRFEEEARLAAHLAHPRICAIHDVGHAAGVDYLVMEFLEGQSLAARLTHGAVPVADLLEYALQIASALAYAHQRHVVHRDLKPANVFVTTAGIKLVDFGLAKLRQMEQLPSTAVATRETGPIPQTEDRVVRGTPQYVAPERLEGAEADYRSDVWSFGAVLHEMATGRRAFDSPTTAGLIAAIMSSEPPPLGEGAVPSGLDWVVRGCLKKDPDARWQSMADVENILKRIASHSVEPPPTRSPMTHRSRSAAALAGIVAAGLILVLSVFVFQKAHTATAEPQAVIAMAVAPPPAGGFTPTEGSVTAPQLAVSPDGRMLAFVASGADGISMIWIRSIDSVTARSIAGTTDATYPFWSANGRSLGFFRNRELRRIDIDGGPSRRIAAAVNGRGGAWNADNVILFAPNVQGPIYRVHADGTGLAPQTALADVRGDSSHRWPQFVPDGRHFLFFASSTREGNEGIYLAALDAPGSTLLTESSLSGAYSPPGHLLYSADGTLVARGLDLANGRLTGDPITIVDGLAGSSGFYGAVSAARTGVLAYATNASLAEIAWFARDGRRLGVAAPRGEYVDFRLSPDGRYLAMAEVGPHSARPDIYIGDLPRGTNHRLTSTRATDASPVWSPDGSQLVFRSNREQINDLYRRALTGTGEDEPFLKTAAGKYPTDWARAGDFVVYHAQDAGTGWDIWRMPVAPRGAPTPLVRTTFNEMQGSVSPDGRWLAYTSLKSGTPDVYVQSLSQSGAEWEISVGGGASPRWRFDGTEVFYVALDGRLMSVAVMARGSFDPQKPQLLFRLPAPRVGPPYLMPYDVDKTGQRFLVRVPLENPETHALTVLVHWSPASPGLQ